MKNDDEVENIPALVEDAKDNPIAFGRLYDFYVQPVYRYLYSRVGTTHDAEDLTSQTFMSAFEYLPRYRENGQFAAWLFRIARSKLMDHFRGNRYEVELEVAEKFGSGGDALVHVIQDEEINCLKSLIGDLDAEEQDLVRLRYVADLTFAEMADLLHAHQHQLFHQISLRSSDGNIPFRQTKVFVTTQPFDLRRDI